MQHTSIPFLHRRTGAFGSPCISLTYDLHRSAQMISRQILNDMHRCDMFSECNGRCSSWEANKSAANMNCPTFLRTSEFHHHHHHHISFMELGHLLTRSGLTYPEVSSKVYQDSFCQLGSSISSFINHKNSGLVDFAFAKFPSTHVFMCSQQ